MKYLFLPILLALVISCKKKEEVKPSYVPSYGTVRIEVTDSNPSAPENFQTMVWLHGCGISNNTYSTASGKSHSYIKEINNVQDNDRIMVQGYVSRASACSTPITIKVSFNGSVLLDKTYIDACSKPEYKVGQTVNLPNYGKK